MPRGLIHVGMEQLSEISCKLKQGQLCEQLIT